MFKKTILSVFLLGTLSTYAQVGIGTVTPDPSSVLDIYSTDKGLLIPRVALIATNNPAPITPAPVEGMMIYNTATGGTSPNIVQPGFYFWNGTIWNRVAIGGAVTKDWTVTGNGDIDATTDFIGTTNAQALRFRTNDQARFEITVDGRLRANNSGTPTLPIYSFEENTDMGMYRGANNDISFATLGARRFQITNNFIRSLLNHRFANGTAMAPSIAFQGSNNTGLYRPEANILGFTTNGTLRFTIPNTNQVHGNSRGTAALPFYSFSEDTDIGMWSPGENLIGFSTSGVERMRILENGRIGINQYNPGGFMHVTSPLTGVDGGPGILSNISVTNSNWSAIEGFNPNTSGGTGVTGIGTIGVRGLGDYAVEGIGTIEGVYGQGLDGVVGLTTDNSIGWAGYFYGDVFTTTGYFIPSDSRIKKNHRKIENALSTINSLNPTLYEKNINIVRNSVDNKSPLTFSTNDKYTNQQRIFNSNHSNDLTEYGLIAQEVELILPNLVKEKKVNIGGLGEIEMKTVNYTGLIPILIQAVKEQQEMIEHQESRIEKLEALVSQLVNKK